ncbi:MAG: acetyl-CoA carboxylase biotin carboxyl carrier protein [Bacteriovoracaceae bacterium]
MKLEDLREFISLAKESGVTRLEYEYKDKRFVVSWESEKGTPVVQPLPVSAPAPTPAAEAKAEAPKKDSGLIEVQSPFVGTFYRSPSPNADSFVKEGDRISSGKVLCIIEAMKIMNEIESEVSGEIVEVCVENETYVEFGQTLFKVRP